jgi:hypothetical protein
MREMMFASVFVARTVLLISILFFQPSLSLSLETMSDAGSSVQRQSPTLIAATRLHLGKAAAPPSAEDLQAKVSNFAGFCADSCQAAIGVLAVDCTPRIAGYDLVEAVQAACDKVELPGSTRLHVLSVTPWGKFVPALNALVLFAASHECKADQILFVSAETSASRAAVETLQSHMTPDTLVAGAYLQGHEYQGSDVSVDLNGRTSPWNTLAVWDLKKLTLTGFQLVSDGVLTDDATDPSFGIEEVVATALLQKLLGADQAKSKLVKLPDVDWNQDFDDPERKQWHEEKMKSKLTRAARQLQLTSLSGTVYHC